MNTYYKISAPAKLNLNLFVRDKILDGLHFLENEAHLKIYLQQINLS